MGHQVPHQTQEAGDTVDLYLRYVDDIVIILKSINPGWSYCKKKDRLTYTENREDGRQPDQKTFDILREVANTLDQDIQMEVDVPSKNQSGKLPVLDLGLSVEDGKIKHSFYSKPMASPFLIKYSSAISSRTKRDSLLQRG